MELYLGFDPGGENQFGWAICSRTNQKLYVLATGEADHAKEAFQQALGKIPSDGIVVGIGIDAPLFWSESGDRDVDKLVRDAIRQQGAKSPGGTVQTINSLRGACIVQGVMLANLLHRRFPEITITESHPKALLYLLGIANKSIHPNKVSLVDLSEYVDCNDVNIIDNKRDAILGSITAFAQRQKRQGWRDLFEEERKPITPFDYSVEYWMPLGFDEG
jgi:hypothetical protein